MSKVLTSATRIVFILIAITTCAGFIIGKINQDQFIGVVTLVFAFYYKGNPTSPDPEPTLPPKTL